MSASTTLRSVDSASARASADGDDRVSRSGRSPPAVAIASACSLSVLMCSSARAASACAPRLLESRSEINGGIQPAAATAAAQVSLLVRTFTTYMR